MRKEIFIKAFKAACAALTETDTNSDCCIGTDCCAFKNNCAVCFQKKFLFDVLSSEKAITEKMMYSQALEKACAELENTNCECVRSECKSGLRCANCFKAYFIKKAIANTYYEESEQAHFENASKAFS